MAFSREELFPKIKTAHGQVNVYGYPHGFSPGPIQHDEARRALEEEVRGFQPHDYVMVEGQHDDHFQALGLPTGEEQDVLESKIRRLGVTGRIERPEFHEIIGLPVVDPGLRMEQFTLTPNTAQEIAEAEEEFSRVTLQEAVRPGMDAVRKHRKEWEESLAHGLNEKKPKEIQRYTEFKLPFRSLLLARAAHYRAEALGGTVRLFTGFLHVDEINRFLKSPERVDEYLGKLQRSHPELERLYKWHEHVNKQILEAFRHSEHLVKTAQRPRWLEFLARNIQADALKAYFTGRHEQGSLKALVERFKEQDR
ncbi:hypothetical protein HY572_00035 [Candidatus Micrarchaeota archaeon]|nr:hypothetical protein [Candidatus Micrarchaeota archaeon]